MLVAAFVLGLALGYLAAPVHAEAEPVAVMVGAGDIATCTTYPDREGAKVAAKSDEKTAALVAAVLAEQPEATVFTLGDNVFLKGSLATYQACYGPSWGAFRERTRPVIGNHERLVAGAAGTFAYFGDAAGPAGRGFYAYDVNGWRVYVLDSQIKAGPGSAQYEWLQQELEANPRPCSVALWHRPVRSSGIEYGSWRAESYPRMQAITGLLYQHGNDLILNASVHGYERLAPHAPDGSLDAAGQRVLIAGTGGRMTYSPTTWKATPLASSEARIKSLGVLRLELATSAYSWQFIGVGSAVLDSGTGSCVDRP